MNDIIVHKVNVADQAKPFYDWVEKIAKQETGYNKSLSEILFKSNKAKIKKIICSCYLNKQDEKPLLFDGIGRVYDHARACFYFFAWIIRDAPQQRLSPLIARMQKFDSIKKIIAENWSLEELKSIDGVVESIFYFNMNPNKFVGFDDGSQQKLNKYIFMFSKNTKYFYNADAIREPHITFTEKSKTMGGRNHFGKRNGTPEKGKNGGNPNLHNGRWDQAFHPNGRNKRTVWEIPLGKFRDAHFAVFPEKLVENCLFAFTQANDYVLDPFCGSGTTGIVALKHNRNFVGIELVKKYQNMAQKRVDTLTVQNTLF
jgi:hypothetical protein